MKKVSKFIIGVVCLIPTVCSATPKKVVKECQEDYDKFCSDYEKDSPKMHRCFEANRNQLSKDCKYALRDSGLIPNKYLKK